MTTLPPPLPNVSAPPIRRVHHALGGIWRLTWHRTFSRSALGVTFVLLVGLGALTALAVPPGNSAHFREWSTGFYLTLLLPVGVFLAAAGAVRDELKPGSVDYVLTRAVPRPAFFAFKYLSLLGCLQLLALLTTSVVIGVGLWRGVPDLAVRSGQLVLAQTAAVTAFSALGILCGTLTARYLVLGLVYGAVVEVGIGRIPMQINRLSINHHVRDLLDDIHAPTALSLIALITLVLLAAAMLVFATREFAGDQVKDA